MLIPLVARMQGQPRRGADRYAAWKKALEQLRHDWMNSPAIEVCELDRYLQGVPVDQQPEAMLDLVAEHLGLSWRAGNGRLLENYLPVVQKAGVALDGLASPPADLVEDEFLARHTIPHGDMPCVEEYARRFPARSDIQQRLRRREIGGGRFVKLARLGQGASGEVWEAFDRAERTPVAMKLPHADSDRRGQWLDYLVRETQLTSELDHPGIIKLCACDSGRPEPIFVMKLVRGNLLSDEIRSYHQPLTTRTASDQQSALARLVRCLAAACDALDYAHARGIVHCDIKPGNVMIDASGGAAVLDWGLGRRWRQNQHTSSLDSNGANGRPGEPCSPNGDASSATCMVAGTPDYMAPEQLTGECEARTDVFGLGATLYEVLAGRAPHAWSNGGRPADWMHRVRDARFARPRRWNPHAPRALEAICLKAISRQPNRRQQRAGVLAAELRSCLSQGQVVGRESLLHRAWHGLAKRR